MLAEYLKPQHFLLSQCCAHALVRFGHKNPLVRVRKHYVLPKNTYKAADAPTSCQKHQVFGIQLTYNEAVWSL